MESWQKRSYRGRRRRRGGAFCNDECHHPPLMFNEKQMSWLYKAATWKRPWSESFPVIQCLYWQSALQPLQTHQLDERDSLLFQEESGYFIIIFTSYEHTMPVRLWNSQASKYFTAEFPTVGATVHIDNVESWVPCLMNLFWQMFPWQPRLSVNEALIQQGDWSKPQYGHWHLRILVQCNMCVYAFLLHIRGLFYKHRPCFEQWFSPEQRLVLKIFLRSWSVYAMLSLEVGGNWLWLR